MFVIILHSGGARSGTRPPWCRALHRHLERQPAPHSSESAQTRNGGYYPLSTETAGDRPGAAAELGNTPRRCLSHQAPRPLPTGRKPPRITVTLHHGQGAHVPLGSALTPSSIQSPAFQGTGPFLYRD